MLKLDVASAHQWITEFARLVSLNSALLTELDRQIGDADHGVNLNNGMRAVGLLNVDDFGSAKEYLRKVGMVLVATVGGASGPLYGSFFLRFGAALPTKDGLTKQEIVSAFQAGLDGIKDRGKAEVGDKTMVDSLTPALATLQTSAAQQPELWWLMTEASDKGRDSTYPLIARKGRASYLGPRSANHQDPGATSAALLIRAFTNTFG